MNFCKPHIYDVPSTCGLLIASGSAVVAELAAQRFDWLLFDMEHGLGDERALVDMLCAVSSHRAAPIVRIPAFRPEYISRALDFGAVGIMVPMVGSAAEAGAVVQAMRYPPQGRRGLTSGNRVSGFGLNFSSYFKDANDRLLTIIQIETPEAVGDIENIAAVEGVDVLFVGHSDLSLSMGCYGRLNDPSLLAAEKKVIAAVQTHGKLAGMLMKTNMTSQDCTAKGFRFLAYGTDISLLKSAMDNIQPTEKAHPTNA